MIFKIDGLGITGTHTSTSWYLLREINKDDFTTNNIVSNPTDTVNKLIWMKGINNIPNPDDIYIAALVHSADGSVTEIPPVKVNSNETILSQSVDDRGIETPVAKVKSTAGFNGPIIFSSSKIRPSGSVLKHNIWVVYSDGKLLYNETNTTDLTIDNIKIPTLATHKHLDIYLAHKATNGLVSDFSKIRIAGGADTTLLTNNRLINPEFIYNPIMSTPVTITNLKVFDGPFLLHSIDDTSVPAKTFSYGKKYYLEITYTKNGVELTNSYEIDTMSEESTIYIDEGVTPNIKTLETLIPTLNTPGPKSRTFGHIFDRGVVSNVGNVLALRNGSAVSAMVTIDTSITITTDTTVYSSPVHNRLNLVSLYDENTKSLSMATYSLVYNGVYHPVERGFIPPIVELRSTNAISVNGKNYYLTKNNLVEFSMNENYSAVNIVKNIPLPPAIVANDNPNNKGFLSIIDGNEMYIASHGAIMRYNTVTGIFEILENLNITYQHTLYGVTAINKDLYFRAEGNNESFIYDYSEDKITKVNDNFHYIVVSNDGTIYKRGT